jgi:hypothetical protein
LGIKDEGTTEQIVPYFNQLDKTSDCEIEYSEQNIESRFQTNKEKSVERLNGLK